MRPILTKLIALSVFSFICLTVSLQLVRGEDVKADNDTATTTISPSIITLTSTLAPDATTLTNDKTDEVSATTKATTDEEEGEDKNQVGTAKPVTEPDKEEEAEGPDDGPDEWGEDDSEVPNIVDVMRDLREKDQYVSVTRNVSHLNETFDRMRAAWEIIDHYYLPEKQTWEKLLGLVTALKVNVTAECFASYFSGVSGFRSYAPWAYRYLDVRGRFPESGSLAGRLSSFGEWDECLELESPKHSSTGLVVKGQYCMMEVKAPYPNNTETDLQSIVDVNHPVYKFIQKYLRAYKIGRMGRPEKVVEALRINNGTLFRAGLCIPALCKAHEIEALIMNLTYPIFKMPITLGPKCYKKDSRMTFDTAQLVAMSVLAILTTFVIFCTVVEWYNDSFDRRTAKDNQKLGSLMFQRDVAYKPNPYIYSFSMVTNTRALLKKGNHFAALDTIKFGLVVYIHLYNYYNYLSTVGLVTLKRIFSTYPITGFRDDRYTWFRLTLPFDAIFVISGMIIAFSMQRKLSSPTSKFNYASYALKLWLKFAVTYAGSILFIFILPTTATGPIWDYGMAWLNGCRDWKTVLSGFFFLSNYNLQLGLVKSPSVLPYCNATSTWFMSALLQLLFIAPVIVFVGHKIPRRGKVVYFLLLTVISAVMSVLPYLLLKIKPEVHFLEFDSFRDQFISYAWYRLGTNTYLVSFVMGIIGGYMLADFKVLLRQELENVILVISFVLVQVAIALNNSFWRLDKSPTLLNSLLWYSAVRLMSSLGLTYIFYTIASNRAHVVQRFLERQPLQTVSRLAYSYFMVHILTIFYRIFSVKEVYAMTNSLMLQNFIIDFMATMLLAYLFYCIIECPIVNLLNLFQGKIFYDVKNYKPRPSTSGDLRGQADINGNGNVTKDDSELGNGSDMLSYPPNIVVQDYDSVSESKQQPNEFEMSPQASTSITNSSDEITTIGAEETPNSEEIATSRL